MEENKEKITEPEMGKREDGQKSPLAKREEEILAFWKKNRIFEKSEAVNSEHAEEFVFYDGPPFATGLPHYGHILAGTLKDVIPRYQTMRGKNIARRWGWDCHGLPIENLIEKELHLKTKKEIEDLGIGPFNEAARKSVLRYADDWKKIVPRMGRWVHMESDYKTMDSSYSETIWWIFKKLFDKDLIYQGFKSMHICPRCETTLSNFEVNLGYKDIADLSVYVKFELIASPKTYVLTWTTTPWTLPGNVALAVNPDVHYVKVVSNGETLILARERLSVLKEPYEIVESFEGRKLIGALYRPLFEYYSNDEKLSDRQNGWKIYGADFVTTEDGTGVVHIAPAFGSDDYELLKRENLPFVQHVGMDGKFKKEVTDFASLPVKPKDDHQKTDIEIIKNLAHRGWLFAKEKINHSYPHCWRCETPLLNYATSSWFVKVSAIKEKLLAENKKVKWVPAEIGENRFGKGIEGAPDWAISRSRYWGAPLPVWKCNRCGEKEVLGSFETLRKKTDRKNSYLVMRHGEALNNTEHIISALAENNHHLTERGKEQAKKTAEILAKEKIDVIVSSPFPRTRETTEILAAAWNLPSEKIIFDPRLGEVNTGVFNLKPITEYVTFFASVEEVFEKSPKNGENFREIKQRMGEALFDLEKRYEGKKILIVTHDTPARLLVSAARGESEKQIIEDYKVGVDTFLQNGQVHQFEFSAYPHNPLFELDVHRPYIDEIIFLCACGGEMNRVPEVFDCWFESGAMPYGEHYYKGVPLPDFDPEAGIGFPADFIAEGLDQTRGWFYSLLVLGVALFGRTPYKSVLVNGLILAEDGRKMSKRLKNYPDPLEVADKYGADSLRYYLLSSPVTHAEDVRFSEKGVDEVMKKIVMRFKNVHAFYEMYCPSGSSDPETVTLSENVLDHWILARLKETADSIAKHLDAYEIDRACWPIMDFVDDLSTWYLRRSRERFKSDNSHDRKSALETLQYVLFQTSKIISPFMPFLAEDVYQKVRTAGQKESVHLELWPEIDPSLFPNERIIEEMKEVRKVVALGLEARSRAGLKVRQPLQKLTVKSIRLKGLHNLIALIGDEVNVKEVAFDEKNNEEVVLETAITPELREEGDLRELVRTIQEFRKEKKLQPNQKVKLIIAASDEMLRLVRKFKSEIMRSANLEKIETREGAFHLKID